MGKEKKFCFTFTHLPIYTSTRNYLSTTEGDIPGSDTTNILINYDFEK